MGTSRQDIEISWQTFDEELKNAGLSMAEFARWYFFEVNEWGDEDEAKKFSEKLKKQRQRKETTPRMVADLANYIQKIYLHPSYEGRVGKVASRRPDYPELNADFHRQMRLISVKIDDMIEDDSGYEEP